MRHKTRVTIFVIENKTDLILVGGMAEDTHTVWDNR